MATTPNYTWPTPNDTDQIADGASAIRALGDAIDATVFAQSVGFRYVGTRYYTSSGTFAKADPLGTGDIGLRAVRVRMVGGIVTSPVLGLVGEAGPEAIIPLDEFGRMGGGPTIVNVTVTSADPQAVVEAIRRYTRNNGPLGQVVSV